MKKQIILLRGASGTGKSTISRHLHGNPCIDSALHESDQFWTDEQGVYHFELTKLKDAHRWNQLQTERSMLHGVSRVVVANTFISHWEMEAYLELAEVYDYEVQIIRTPGPWDAGVLFERNEHSVPLNVINRQITGYKEHPDEFEWTDMSIFR